MTSATTETLQAMREALAFAKGEADPSRFTVHTPEDIDQDKRKPAVRPPLGA